MNEKEVGRLQVEQVAGEPALQHEPGVRDRRVRFRHGRHRPLVEAPARAHPSRPHLALIFAASVLTDATLGQPASAEVAPYNLVAPVAEYKIYDSENAQYLVTSTRAFTER
jgi:hypothetical protein